MLVRDLTVFPITKDEVLSTLDHYCMVADDDDGTGSIDAFVLQRVFNVMNREFKEEDFSVD